MKSERRLAGFGGPFVVVELQAPGDVGGFAFCEVGVQSTEDKKAGGEGQEGEGEVVALGFALGFAFGGVAKGAVKAAEGAVDALAEVGAA